MLPPLVESRLSSRKPFLWLNEAWLPLDDARANSPLNIGDVRDAEHRLHRFAGLLSNVFPELAPAHGIVESPLYPADALQAAMASQARSTGRWFIKGDHALPVAGSVKARGGLYEVLLHAEDLAQRHGLMRPPSDCQVLASPEGRALFGRHQIAVGSTGNLGLSIGVMAAALGFQVTVHMSSDAKEWKKERLRRGGVRIIEHTGDYAQAVAAGRAQARGDPGVYFVDDENSTRLFLGYSVAALRLQRQLIERDVKVDAQHPLFVYLPCGVGGAPGGITFGLRHLLGDHVHCFFAEPVASPCMLIRLASPVDSPLSVQDVGLDNRTEADGLAVACASESVASQMRPLVSGVFTVPDDDLFEDLFLLEQTEGMRIEPSAAAGFRGPRWLFESAPGAEYLVNRGLLRHMDDATHILWTTGGAFVPDEEYCRFHRRGRQGRNQ
jgi:D-serine dehydratase